MQLIFSTNSHECYIDYFQGIPVRMSKEKATGQIYFNSDDVAKCLGYGNLKDMLIAEPELLNKFLDGINNGMVRTS